MTLLDFSQQIFGNRGNSYSPAQIAATETNGADVLYGTAQADADSGEVEVLIDGTEIPTDPDDPDYELASTMTCDTEELIQAGDRVTVVRNGQNAKAIVLSQESTGVAAAAQAADDAAKTATDFLTMDETSGLTVGASSLERSVNINAGGVDIIDGSTILAHYGSYTQIGAEGIGGVTIIGGSINDVNDWDGTAANPYIAVFDIIGVDIDASRDQYIPFNYSARKVSPNWADYTNGDVAKVAFYDTSGKYLSSPVSMTLADAAAVEKIADSSYINCWVDIPQWQALGGGARLNQTMDVIGPLDSYLYPAQLIIQGDLAAQSISSPIATASALGVVKVDGSTITAASDGTISAVGSSPITPADTSWAYLTGDSSSSNYCRWRCKSGWVQVEINYESGAAVPRSGSKLFGTIQSGYCPDRVVSVPCYFSSNNTGSAWVETDGEVRAVTMASSSQSTCYAAFSYPLD